MAMAGTMQLPTRRPPKPPRRGAPSARPQLSKTAAAVAAAAVAALLLALLFLRPDDGAALARCPQPGADASRIKRVAYAGEPPMAPDRFTLLLNSFRRHDLLKASIAHYAQCAEADAIRVVWSEDMAGPPTSAQDAAFYSEAKEVTYDVQPTPSLNNRFRPPPGLRTAAVLSIDDDVIVPCCEVAATFQAWKTAQEQLVGWFPRGHATNEGCTRRYLLRDAAVLMRGRYSIILTKGAFLHRDWLATYSAVVPPPALAYIDAHRNCEDIAMAFLVANVTGAAPLYHRAPHLQDLGQGIRKVKGISSLGGHAGERSSCLNEFERIFGGMPLMSRPLSDHPHPWLLRLSTLWDRAL